MREKEIRPRELFKEFLRLCAEDTKTYFSDTPREEEPCPTCDGVGEVTFAKHGFDYETCPEWDNLFVNPRPISDAFARYYPGSPSSRFWATTFYKETAAARRGDLWKPQTRMVRDALERYTATGFALVDLGGGYGLFPEEMKNLSGQYVTVIEPGPHLASAHREESVPVVGKVLEQVDPGDPAPRGFCSSALGWGSWR